MLVANVRWSDRSIDRIHRTSVFTVGQKFYRWWRNIHRGGGLGGGGREWLLLYAIEY